MWSIFNKKKQKGDEIGGLLNIDIHAHWLPGIDDGAKNVEQSIEMIRKYVDMGYRKLIATPHIYSQFYQNDEKTIKAAFDKLSPYTNEAYPELELSYAAEYFLDDYFQTLLAQKSLLPVFENFVLVEQSFLAETPGLEQYFFEMQVKGYRPIFAHVERYIYYKNQLDRLISIRDSGVKFQVNLLSLAGKYGTEIQKQAMFLVKNDLVDYWGTDAHSVGDLKKIADMQVPSGTIKAMNI